MPDPAAGLAAQIRNIEATYGRSMPDWFAVIQAAGLTKHSDVVALLKSEHGLAHGAAHRISLQYKESLAAAGGQPAGDPVDLLYAGAKAALRPVHEVIIGFVAGLGDDIVATPKKGYLSLTRRRQFAMVQPSTATRLDLGLILKGVPPSGRLEDAAKFKAMFTHRVRLSSAGDVDDDVRAWLRAAYGAAG